MNIPGMREIMIAGDVTADASVLVGKRLGDVEIASLMAVAVTVEREGTLLGSATSIHLLEDTSDGHNFI